MNLSSLLNSIAQLSNNALKRSHRQVVVLHGDNSWADALLKQIYQFDPLEGKYLTSLRLDQRRTEIGYIYQNADTTMPLSNVNQQTFNNNLGTESHAVVFYINELNVDALAALSGTLLSGGLLYLVIPEEFQTSSVFKQSLFNQRFIDQLFADKSVAFIKKSPQNSKGFVVNDFTLSLLPLKSNTTTLSQTMPLNQLDMGCLTLEQLTAVKAIIHVVTGHRNRPLVISADRGRGKSSALAIACAHFLNQSSQAIKIAITATHRKSLAVFFDRLAESVISENSVFKDANTFKMNNSSVTFMAVDELVKTPQTFNLVIVDEAASIPANTLNYILKHFHRTVFASTVHGYEGAGRSFTLKFQKRVLATYPESKLLTINQPIRWSENDPVEAFVNRLCLLNTELKDITIDDDELSFNSQHVDFKGGDFAGIDFKIIDAKTLIENEELLRDIFALLVTAHYQTSPNDLRLLLDNKSISIAVLATKKCILGVSLLMLEGNVTNQTNYDVNEEELSQSISLIQANKRRLKNQFIPQSLLTHCGEESSFNYSYLRVMRIAIMPQIQKKGLGTFFLAQIERYTCKQSIDFVGSSFGATPQLLNFWQQQSYKIIRVGFTKDKASGEHSVLVLKAIKPNAKPLLKRLERNFYQTFDYFLPEQFKNVEAQLVWQIMHTCPSSSLPVLTKDDLKAVKDFYTTTRQYSVCVYHLHKWLQHQMLKPYKTDMVPMIEKVFKKKDVATVCDNVGFSGKKALNQFLIEFTQQYWD